MVTTIAPVATAQSNGFPVPVVIAQDDGEEPVEEEFVEEEEVFEEDFEEFTEDGFDEEYGDSEGESFQGGLEDLPGKPSPNPLNPVGGNLEQLIQTTINDDLWESMLGDLPCLDSSSECIQQLQNLAVRNHRALSAIDERVELVSEKIDEARARNQRSITLGSFTPYIESLVRLEVETEQVIVSDLLTGQSRVQNQEREIGFFQKIARAIANPLQGINELLSFVGVPLFNGTFRIGDASQAREIAISDLQVKIAQVEAERQKIADTIAEQVVLQVIDFDVYRRDFQISQEIAKRQTVQHQLFAIDYRFGNYDTSQYLTGLSAIDREKGNAYRAWAKMRSQLTRIQLLVLGTEGT